MDAFGHKLGPRKKPWIFFNTLQLSEQMFQQDLSCNDLEVTVLPIARSRDVFVSPDEIRPACHYVE